jgi:hypothetical protein
MGVLYPFPCADPHVEELLCADNKKPARGGLGRESDANIKGLIIGCGTDSSR